MKLPRPVQSRILSRSIATLFGLACSSALAAPATWTGTTDSSFATGANWGGTAPVSGDSFVFTSATGAGGLLLNNNLTGAAFNVAGLTFNAGSGAYVIGNGTSNANVGNTFALTGGITNSSTNLQTINNPFSLTSAQTVTMTTGGGNVTLAGNISGTNGGFTLAGTGTLTLAGSNSFTGGITVAGKILQLQANANNTTTGVSGVMPTQNMTLAQFATASTIQLRADSAVASNGVVAFNSGATAFGVNATGTRLTGTYNFDVNQLTAAGGSNLTLQFGAANAIWQVGTASNIFNVTGGNGYTLQLGTFNVGNNANTTVNNTTANTIIAGLTGTNTGTLVKTGAGTLTISAASTYSGGTSIGTAAGAAVLRAAATTALGSGAIAFDATGNGSTARLELIGGITLANAVTFIARNNTSVAIENISGNNTMSGLLALGTGGTNYTIQSDAGTLALTNTGTATVTLNKTVFLQGAGNGSLATIIAGAGGITKSGAGTWTLTGANTFTAAALVSGGTLAVSGTGAMNSASGITLNGSGAKLLHTSSVASTRAITQTLGTLDGTGTVGAVSVASNAANVVTNGNGGTAALTVGSLAFSGAATLTANVGSAPGIAITGALTTTPASGQVTVNGSSPAWANGLTNLVSFGTFGGAISDFSKGTFTGLSGRQTADSLQLNGSNIALNIIGDNPLWTGANGGIWQQYAQNSPTSATPAWKLQAGGTDTDFWVGDTAVFDDNASGTTTVTVHGGNVSPAALTFNNSNKNYTITTDDGSGIASGSLTKNGTGRLTINVANTSAGGTALNAGTLVLGNASAIGTGLLTITGGTLDSSTTTVLSTNNAQAWNGDFSFAGTANLDLGSGAVTLGGTGTDRTVTASANTLAVGEIKSTTLGFAKQGAGTLVVATTGVGAAGSSIGGSLNVAAGTLQINKTGAVGGDAFTGDFTATGLAGSGTIVNGAGEERWVVINTTGTNTFSGTLANGGTGALGFNKQGSGTMTLSGNNTNTGTITVGGGTLTLTGSNSFTGPVNVATGILNVQNSGALGSSVVSSVGRNSGIQLQGGISLPSSVSFITSNDGLLGALVPYAINNVSGNNTINGPIALTSGGGSSIIQSDSGALTLAGNITIAAGQTSRGIILQGASTDANTFSGGLSNLSATAVASIAKNGSGTWTLSGANIYTGTTTVTAGTLNVSGSLANTAVTVSGGTLSLQRANALSQGSLTLSGTGLLDEQVDNAISGSATLIAQKSLTLSRPNAYSGDTTINAGTGTTVTITDIGAAGTSRLNAATGATSAVFTLHINCGGPIAMANSFGGNSGITTTIDVANNGSGTDGVIQFGSAGFYGNGTLNVTGSNGYSLALVGFLNNAGTPGTTVLNPTTANLSLGSFTSTTDFAKALQLAGTSSGNTVTGSISNGTNVVSVSKTGTSVWTLSGDSSYTGGTTVSDGTLVVSGTLTGTPTLAVNGGTFQLGGSNRLNDSVAVGLGGGTLSTAGFSETVGALTLSVASTIDLGSGASSLHFADSSAPLWAGTLSITNWSGSAVDQVFFGTGSSALSANNLAAIQFVDPAGFQPGVYGAQILATGEVIAAIPEPSALLSLLGGFGVLLGLRRRRAC